MHVFFELTWVERESFLVPYCSSAPQIRMPPAEVSSLSLGIEMPLKVLLINVSLRYHIISIDSLWFIVTYLSITFSIVL